MSKKIIIEQLIELQISQNGHYDNSFCPKGGIHRKLSHIALHFATRSGIICDCILNTQNPTSLKNAIIDSFMLSITCANILNIRISDKLSLNDDQDYKNLLDIGMNIAGQFNTEDRFWLIKAYPVIVGELSKACEAIDHLEPQQYREAIIGCAIKLFSLSLVVAHQLNIDLVVEQGNKLATFLDTIKSQCSGNTVSLNSFLRLEDPVTGEFLYFTDTDRLCYQEKILKALSTLYKSGTGFGFFYLIDRVNTIFFHTYFPIAHEVTAEEINLYFEKKYFLFERIKQKAIASGGLDSFFSQPTVLMAYYLADTKPNQMQPLWPFDRTYLADIFSDLGRCLHA